MRATEFISKQVLGETAEENQELNALSGLAINYIIDYWKKYSSANRNWIISTRQAAKEQGKSTELMPLASLGGIPGLPQFKSQGILMLLKFYSIAVFYIDNAPYKVAYEFEGAPAGYCDSNRRLIAINENQLDDPRYLSEIFAHEAQHAIDDLKSRKGLTTKSDYIDADLSGPGAALSAKNKIKGPVIAPTAKSKFISYLQLPDEVNARFTEVLQQLTNEIANVPDYLYAPSSLVTLIKTVFSKHYMDDAFPNGVNDPAYKRLMSRTYKFLDAQKQLVVHGNKPDLEPTAVL